MKERKERKEEFGGDTVGWMGGWVSNILTVVPVICGLEFIDMTGRVNSVERQQTRKEEYERFCLRRDKLRFCARVRDKEWFGAYRTQQQ